MITSFWTLFMLWTFQSTPLQEYNGSRILPTLQYGALSSYNSELECRQAMIVYVEFLKRTDKHESYACVEIRYIAKDVK
jgi:hypothetical protein